MNVSGKSLVNPLGPQELLEPIRGVKEDKRKTDEEYLREAFKSVLKSGGGND